MNLNVVEEYQFLETVSEKPPESFTEKLLKYPKATSFYNFTKNRYPNILPKESTRVKLQPLEGVPDSDYINANHVSSGGSSYICCQAPIPSTFSDFWRMVWEQDASVLVMLTELVSGEGQVKADCYWPTVQQPSIFVADITISLDGEQQDGNFIVRWFTMCKKDGDGCSLSSSCSERKICQVQYIGWPDFSLPSHPSEFMELLSLVEKKRDKENRADGSKKPIVVHCSAGVGRTGVFVAARTCLKMAKQTQKVEILQLVKNLRDQRPGMVSTLQQYQFLHTFASGLTLTKRRPLTCNQVAQDPPLPLVMVEPFLRRVQG